MARTIPYSKAPPLTPQQLKNEPLEIALLKKEITMEQALKQGYVEPDDMPWGMSDLRPDEPTTPQK